MNRPNDVVTLHDPTIRYRSTNTSEYDAAMDWRADMLLTPVQFGREPIVGGHVDFVTIRLGETDVAPMLDCVGGSAELFASLFDGPYLSAEVEDQFMDVGFNNVLIILNAYIEPPLRGHNLGAWMVAEVIARMGAVVDTLVVLYPHPTPAPDDYAARLGAIATLDTYWRKVGLIPLDADPRLLGHTTAYQALTTAREALTDVRDSLPRLPAATALPDQTTAAADPSQPDGAAPDDEQAPGQAISTHQRLDFVEGITAAHDHLVLIDDHAGASVAVHHSNWAALAAAVEYFRVVHCEDCPS